jgi:hypothetical protein
MSKRGFWEKKEEDFFVSLRNGNKRGQIWVETVIYILIAFVMLGLVLSFVRPKIEELRDKIIIEQSIETMNDLESVFSDVLVPGNKRIVEVSIRKGEFNINSENDSIEFEIDSSYIYSEPGETIFLGNLNITTIDLGDYAEVRVIRDFSERYNLTYQNSEESKSLTRSSVPYRISITNKGEDDSGRTIINMEMI